MKQILDRYCEIIKENCWYLRSDNMRCGNFFTINRNYVIVSIPSNYNGKIDFFEITNKDKLLKYLNFLED